MRANLPSKAALHGSLLTVAALVVLLFAVGAPAYAATSSDEPYWDRLVTWEDSLDAQSLDMSSLSLWASTDRQLSFEFTMFAPFASEELSSESHNWLRILLDTDLNGATGVDIGDGMGADYMLDYAVDGDGYLMGVVRTPNDDTNSWSVVSTAYAYLDKTDPSFPVLGADFPASAIGDPTSLRVVAVSRWVSPSSEEVVDWLPEDRYGEVDLNYPVGLDTGFGDVPGDHPYAGAIAMLSQAGIISGYGDSTFKPANPVWRQHFAKMIVLALGLPVSEADICPFKDVTKSGPDSFYPDNYIAVCAAKKITLGKTATTFEPEKNITRAQLVTMVVRALDAQYPGLLGAPPVSYRSTWGNFSVTHQANAARAEYNGLLIGLPLSTLDPLGPMTRGETAQVLANALLLLEQAPAGE